MPSFLNNKFTLLLISIIILAGGLLGRAKSEKKASSSSKEVIYIGTFDRNESQGLYVYEFNPETLKMTKIQTVNDRKGPNFQAIGPAGNYLYSVSGEAFSDTSKAGTITAYRIDQKTGKLTLINEQSIGGVGPAHVSVDPKGRFVYASNYGSGSLSVFAIQENGGLSPAIEVIQHQGSSINKERQQAPHVHSIIPSPDGRFIYVSDLGTDQIKIYKVNQETGNLSPAETPYFKSTPGAGPRHFVIHPNGKVAYSVEELSSAIAVLKIDPSTGALTQIQHISTVPEDYEGENFPADIHISPNGQFLYTSNRGHNSLAIYKIDEATGKLMPVGYQQVKGKWPRNFRIGQRGTFVWAANLNSDNVVLFKRDKATGKLSYTGTQVKVPAPVCVTQLILE